MQLSWKLLAATCVVATGCSGEPAGPGGDPGSLYAAAVLADGPVAYWRFEEASGTIAADSSGSGRHGIYLEGIALGDSLGANPTGKAVSIEDDNQGVSVAYAAWTNLSSLTVEAWVRATSVTSSEGTIIVDKGSTWNLFLDVQGRPAFQFPGDVPPETLGLTPLVVGQVYHLAGTFEAGVMRLYVNGAMVSEATGLGATIPSNPTEIHIGRGLSLDRFGFRGTIDEVALYDKALSGAAILAHYDAGK